MVHAERCRKVWRLNDGFPLQGKTYYYNAGPSIPGTERQSYPTGTVLDEFYEAMMDAAEDFAAIVGRQGVEWLSVTAAPWVYPVGSALSFHQDSGESSKHHTYMGAYSFYVHPSWNIHWGGWLIVFEEASLPLWNMDKRTAVFPPWLSDDSEQHLVSEPGVARCIAPAPNRVVFIGPNTPHLISRVDANAGSKPRVSIAGFFLKNTTQK